MKAKKSGIGIVVVAAIVGLGIYFLAKQQAPHILVSNGHYYCPYKGEELKPYAGGLGPSPEYRVLGCPLGHGPITVPGVVIALGVV